MERWESRLFAPYKTLGGVCSAVAPAYRTLPTKRRITSVLCAIGNVVAQYTAERLRLVSISDVLPGRIQCIAADKRYVYVAVGKRVALLHLSRQVRQWIDAEFDVKLMLSFGEILVIVDVQNSVVVFSIEDGERILQVDFSTNFEITAVVHPATYLNKILVGSSRGELGLINVKSGKLVHHFETSFNDHISVLTQTPAIDVIAIGFHSGQIVLHNIKYDKTIATFRQDSTATAIAFRNDGEETMVSASALGVIAVWDLNKKVLIGQVNDAHADSITSLHFFVNEPLMVSSGSDNVLKTWIFDMGDGMPRQLVMLEGHSKPVTTLKFSDGDCVLSAGMDGTLRSFSVKRDTQRQKLGNAGTMSRSKAKKIGLDLSSIALDVIEDLAIQHAREAAWDNILCRHRNTAITTTWTSRNRRLGEHKLLHKRFYIDPLLTNAFATSICLTACGNFALIGYSSGHIDCFNIQSGRHRKTFAESESKETAHNSAVFGISVDPLNALMVSAEEKGLVRFWRFLNRKLISEMRVPSPVVRFRMCPNNSLLAIAVGNGSIGVVDILCRRLVRIIKEAHDATFTVLEFSPDSKWLLSADEAGTLKVWDLVTNSLIDVMNCKSPCLSASFSVNGEYLATAHREDRLVYLWANKVLFGTCTDLVALPHDYVPSTSYTSPVSNLTKSIDDANAELEEIENGVSSQDFIENSELVVFSGLATPRWANLPDLDIIRERNKPLLPPQKPKAAPFFLSSLPTLEGFEFEKMEVEETAEQRKFLMAKKSMLEIESSFTKSLLRATADDDYLKVFSSLKAMSISSIDFQIRTLPAKALRYFLKMLLLVVKTKADFELVQAYLAACLKAHREALWTTSGQDEDLDVTLKELYEEIRSTWNSVDNLIKENCAIIRWIKSAVV